MKKKRKKSKKVVILLLLVAVIAAAAFFLLRGKKQERNLLSANVRQEEVVRGDIRIITEGNGSIEAADEVTVAADNTLTIDTVEVENGDVVSEGDVIATVDEDSIAARIGELETQLSELNAAISAMDKSGSSSLTSPVSGRVKRIYAKAGEVLTDVMADHGGIMELSADGKLKVEISSSEKLKIGEEVNVDFLSYEEEGVVVSEDDGVYTITIEDDSSYLVDTEVTVTDSDDVFVGTGYLASNHPYLVEGAYGIVDEVTVDVGDYVDSGTTLLTRTNTQYNGDYLARLEERKEITDKLQELRTLEKDPRLLAAGGGIVSELALLANTVVTEDAPMYQLISTDRFWLKAEIDELDIAGVSEGQTATLVFDAFDGEEYEGKVEKVSALGQNVNGVTKYTVTISVPGIEKVKTAMSATAKIVTDERTDVLLVPVDAIQTVDGEKYVTVVRGETQESVPVTLGLVNNTQAEVTEGVSEGDKVVVAGKSDFEVMMDMMQQSRSRMQGGEE